MSVNLLPSEAKFQASKVKFQKKVVSLSKLLVVLWFAVAVAVGGIWLLFRQLYESEKRELSRVENTYDSLSSKLITNQKLRYKVKLVSMVLNDRFEYAKAFKSVQSFFPSEAVVNSLEIREGSVFVADVSLNGSRAVDDLESRIRSVGGGGWPDIKVARVTSLEVDGGAWTANVEVELK